MSREPDPKDPGDETLDRLLTMSADPPQLSPEARARLLTRLQRSRAAEISMTKPRWTTPAYALAAVAASALLIWGVTRDQDLSEGTDTGLQATKFGPGSMLENPGKRPLGFTLADGSTAILREGAALRVTSPRRLELLRGEALLDVVPGERTFTVGTPAGEVEVRGTKFLLRQEAETLLTGVLRGEVRLFNKAGDATLLAGEAGTLSPGTGPARRPGERLSHELQWARDALQDPAEELSAVRRGNLLARFPTWPGEWPLPVRVMDVDVYIEDGVARTTIDQTFFNHTDYELEGVYSFPLPADAAIARLAMYVDGKLMEAGITERQEGRQIYESIVYRRRDPALGSGAGQQSALPGQAGDPLPLGASGQPGLGDRGGLRPGDRPDGDRPGHSAGHAAGHRGPVPAAGPFDHRLGALGSGQFAPGKLCQGGCPHGLDCRGLHSGQGAPGSADGGTGGDLPRIWLCPA